MRQATLILGGGGFIGKRLIATLQQRDAPIVVLGRGIDDARAEGFLQRRGSLEDTTLLRELIEQCSAVVYLACVTTPGASAREPALEVTGNLLPLARFLEVAQDLEPRRLIFVSSAGTVYGESGDGVAEDVPLRPRSYYGAGKVAAEAMLHAFAVNSQWPTIVLRPTNVYGPGQLPTKGFAIVPTIFRHMLERRPFEIWGDGSVVRDYLYVDDLAKLIADLPDRRVPPFSVYNVGSGAAVSILELVRRCEAAAGRRVETVLRPARKVDVPRAIPSTAAIRAAYAWRAATDLNAGLGQTWTWLRTLAAADTALTT